MTKQTRVRCVKCKGCGGAGVISDRWCDECEGRGETKEYVEVEVKDEFTQRTQEQWGDFQL